MPTAQPPQVRQVSLMIPTYQFADGLRRTLPTDPIYPYKRLDFSRVGPPQPQTYQALVLENDYVALTIVPELGGRVLRWVDQATGDTPFYANPVFKPTHWGSRGWWFATGGMEWAFPTEEHGLVEWEPWGYRIRQESTRTTVAVTDQDEHTGLELEVGIGLETDSSAVYISPRIRNPLEQGCSYEFWINAMIALTDNWASEQLEFVLPTEEVTVHSTGDTGLPPPEQPLPWPIYEGRDLSYYRNWRAYLGIFAYPQAQAGFMGAYDHSSDRGIVRIFPASIVRGAKVFGGKDLDPYLWADDKSTYVELWGGVLPRFGETSILGPGEALTWTEVWYTVSRMGGFAYADEKAALRLEVGPDLVTAGVASIRSFEGKLVLQQDGREVAHWPLALQPGRGVVRTWRRLGSDEARWDLQLLDSEGQVVASWRLTTD
jgi:hypothetical protein